MFKAFDVASERCAGGKFSKVGLTRLAVGNGVDEKLLFLVIENCRRNRVT